MKSYTIQSVPPGLLDEFNWEGSIWSKANVAEVDAFHPHSHPEHRPRTRVRLMHDGQSLFLKFTVDDRHVLSRFTEYGQPVWKDSCVEFFVQPRPDRGYLNFEFNCGGTMLLSHVEDWTRPDPNGPLAKATPVAPDLARQVSVSRSMPRVVWPEIDTPTKWWLGCVIPLTLLEAHVGPLGTLSGQSWRGNFFKCADESSHPHWAAWSPVGEALNFHQPRYFGEMVFE